MPNNLKGQSNIAKKALFYLGTILGSASVVLPAKAQPVNGVRPQVNTPANIDIRGGNFQPLSPSLARDFFGSLYATPPGKTGDNFDAITALLRHFVIANRIVTRLGSAVVRGDEAIQALLSNYVLTHPSNVKKDRQLTAALAGIKQRAVQEFADVFPTANLDTLINAAQEAGYEVEVLQAR